MVRIESLTYHIGSYSESDGNGWCRAVDTSATTGSASATTGTYSRDLVDIERGRGFRSSATLTAVDEGGIGNSTNNVTFEDEGDYRYEVEGDMFYDSRQHATTTMPSPPLRKSGALHFRDIQPCDRQQIQDLHEEWFPVRYQQEFYDDLVYGKMCHTGEDLYTKLAIHDNTIAACVVAAKVPANRLNKTSRNLLLPQPDHHYTACYIMTLGTVSQYRNMGLATRLIEKCVQDLVLSDPSCGALYLHVITSNDSAIRFYERLGFWRVQEIDDYYTIDNQYYNCYLYAKYFHGNRGHLDVFQVLAWWISSVWNKVKVPLYYLIKGSTPRRLTHHR